MEGEAEEALLEVVDTFSAGGDPRTLRNVSYLSPDGAFPSSAAAPAYTSGTSMIT